MATPKLVDAAALAALLATSERQIFEWYRGRRIPGIKLSSRCLRFDPVAVLATIKKGKATEQSAA
jgi:hypothetical protein